MSGTVTSQAMVHVVAPDRRRATRWAWENGIPREQVRHIWRPDQLGGMDGREVIIVDRGACTGPAWKAVLYALELEQAGRITARIVFTKDN